MIALPLDLPSPRFAASRPPPRFGSDPGQLEPDFAARVARDVGRLYADDGWFSLHVDGWEHLPPAPALVVSNHSGGTTIPDVWGLMVAWYRRFGMYRPMHALAHDMIFAVPAVGEWFSRLGVLRAGPGIGQRVLTEWRRDLFVCPGGDLDTWRPYRDRYKVRFSGRTGYARLALRTGVPVVPLANGGAHESLVVLTDGAALARRLHLHQHFRAEVFPVHLSLPWGVGVGPLPHLPWPVALRYRFGPAVPFPEGWVPTEDPPDAVVAAYDAKVRAAIQQLLDSLAAEAEPLPVRLRRMGRAIRRARRRPTGEA